MEFRWFKDTIYSEFVVKYLEQVRVQYLSQNDAKISKVTLVCDNEAYHKSHKIREYLKEVEFRMMTIPACVPWLNSTGYL